MKQIVSYLAGFVTALGIVAAGAATVTINTTAPDDARLGPAYGDKLGLRNGSGQPRNATTAEVKAYLIGVMRADVQAYEDRIAKAAVAAPSAFDPT